jgi:hypothetical protein
MEKHSLSINAVATIEHSYTTPSKFLTKNLIPYSKIIS